MKILLLGGGYVLSNLASKLEQSEFVITTRSLEKLNHFKSLNWNAYKLDLSDKKSVECFFDKHSDFTHIIDSVPPHTDDSNVLVKNILSSKHANLKRIIYLSTTGVFGVSDGSWVNEEIACNPQNPKALARQACENLYLGSKLPVTILRLPAIWGPERGIVNALRAGTLPYINNGNRWTNRIHVEDLVEILLKLLKFETAKSIYCVCDDKPTLMSEVVEFYCSKLQLALPVSITEEDAKARKLYMLLSNQRISNQLLKKDLKIELKHPTYRD